MDTLANAPQIVTLPPWRDVVWPKEHGSWSLAFEPVALGLLAAPSIGGAALAVGIAGAFLARRPLRIGLFDLKAARRVAARRAAVACGAVAVTGWFLAMSAAGIAWTPWLLPTAAAGAGFLYFDLQLAGREQYAETAGAAAFGWLPAVFAVLGGWSAATAAALGLVMLARAVPTVLTVRATLRARKSGEVHATVPLAAALLAVVAIVEFARENRAPWTAAVLVGLLAIRSAGLLLYPRPKWRASTVGMIEAALGIVFVLATALAWRL